MWQNTGMSYISNSNIEKLYNEKILLEKLLQLRGSESIICFCWKNVHGLWYQSGQIGIRRVKPEDNNN